MNNIIESKLKLYNPQTKDDYINTLKEMIQEIALCSLASTNFFDYAAFCGGTALRIFYGLNRASEDLDFSLINNEKNDFKLEAYFDKLKEDFSLYGFTFSVLPNNKNNIVQSAFLKGNTLNNLLVLELPQELQKYISNNESMKIKFEIDLNPPTGFKTEYKIGYFPIPYKVRIFDKESLFAGKLHAIIYRTWDNRVKGRDYYDLIFYVNNNIKPNIDMLRYALIQTNNIKENDEFNNQLMKELLLKKISTVDFELAKKDVIHFLKNHREIELWSCDFFKIIIEEKL